MAEHLETRLNKRAASRSTDAQSPDTHRKAKRPLWYVGDGVSTFAGPLQRNHLHSHSVPVLLTGLYGPFRFRSERGRWTVCRSTLVAAGRSYEFDMAGEPLSVIYLEPSLAGAGALAPLLREAREQNGLLHGNSDHIGALRSLYEDQASASWAGDALLDLLQFARRRSRRDLDARVARVVRSLQVDAASSASAEAAAQSVGLSGSRFQHLFTAEVGVPYRRYRAWRRMLLAIGEVVSGANLTDAAHASGYADQAHFARDFRRMFGASASVGIANIRG
jgi:AraC-like DNA-binding protein